MNFFKRLFFGKQPSNVPEGEGFKRAWNGRPIPNPKMSGKVAEKFKKEEELWLKAQIPLTEDEKQEEFLKCLQSLTVANPPHSFQPVEDRNTIKIEAKVVLSGVSASEVLGFVKSKIEGTGLSLGNIFIEDRAWGFNKGFEGTCVSITVGAESNDDLKGNSYTSSIEMIYIFRQGQDQFMCVRYYHEFSTPAEW